MTDFVAAMAEVNRVIAALREDCVRLAAERDAYRAALVFLATHSHGRGDSGRAASERVQGIASAALQQKEWRE